MWIRNDNTNLLTKLTDENTAENSNIAQLNVTATTPVNLTCCVT